MPKDISDFARYHMPACDRIFLRSIEAFLPDFAEVKGSYITRVEMVRPHQKRPIPVDIKLEVTPTHYVLSYYTRSEYLEYAISHDGSTVRETKHEVAGDVANETLTLEERQLWLFRLARDIAIMALRAKSGKSNEPV